ncbi:MAG TPA: RNA polymerase sigma-54 factor, partial [Ramlibacter sp.]
MQTMSLQAGTHLQPTLSPRLQRAVRLLQMSSLDFSQVVRDALDNNPFLESEEGDQAAGTSPMDDAEAVVAEHPLDGSVDGSGWG